MNLHIAVGILGNGDVLLGFMQDNLKTEIKIPRDNVIDFLTGFQQAIAQASENMASAKSHN